MEPSDIPALTFIRERLENATLSGDPVSLDDAFAQIEAYHQQQLTQAEDVAS